MSPLNAPDSAPPPVPELGEADPRIQRREVRTLLISILCVAACGLVYELLIATVASYLLGSSVTQFSISIGLFIGSMGLGSWLSQRVRGNLLDTFILAESVLGILGGMAVWLLFWTYPRGLLYHVVFYPSLIAIGALTGLELPLLTRLLKAYGTLRRVLAQAFSFDYLGALAGAVLFPLVLLPWLGMMRTAFVVGLANLGVAGWNLVVFRNQDGTRARLWWTVSGGAVILAGGLVFSVQLVSLAENRLYRDPIVHTAQTPYQRIVLTRWKDDFRLFLDGNLQFSSTDEYRYHEALIHPAVSLCPVVERVLVLGGGDGLAVRELLKYPRIQSITLVDIDPAMTRLAQDYPDLVALNGDSLKNPKVRLVHRDAAKFLETDDGIYELVVADLPDPNTEVLAKLYTVEFYRLIHRRLAATGIFVTQASSPYFSREAFWCIARTIEKAGLHVAPYHLYVPSFGEWGFVLAAGYVVPLPRLGLAAPTRHLTADMLAPMFRFGKDEEEVPTELSTLDHPAVFTYYQQSVQKWDL